MTDAPERLRAWAGSYPYFSDADWFNASATEDDERGGTEYIRADLHDAQLAALRDRVEALSLALSHIDAMDPEERMIGGVSEHAAKGLLLRMGEVARAVLKADQ